MLHNLEDDLPLAHRAVLAKQRQDKLGRVARLDIVTPWCWPDPHRLHIQQWREQPDGGVQGVYIDHQAVQPRLVRLDLGGDLLALAEQAGQDGVAGVAEFYVRLALG